MCYEAPELRLSTAMNTDAGVSLLNNYLNDACSEEDATALVFTIEEDPELLDLLCDYTSLESSLRDHLAAAGERPKLRPRHVPFWHWRRAGLWIASGAAACVT